MTTTGVKRWNVVVFFANGQKVMCEISAENKAGARATARRAVADWFEEDGNYIARISARRANLGWPEH